MAEQGQERTNAVMNEETRKIVSSFVYDKNEVKSAQSWLLSLRNVAEGAMVATSSSETNMQENSAVLDRTCIDSLDLDQTRSTIQEISQDFPKLKVAAGQAELALAHFEQSGASKSVENKVSRAQTLKEMLSLKSLKALLRGDPRE